MTERDIKIAEMRKSGYKLQTIADKYGISKERVRQIHTKVERFKTMDDSLQRAPAFVRHPLWRAGVHSVDDLKKKLEDGVILEGRCLGAKGIEAVENLVGRPVEQKRRLIYHNWSGDRWAEKTQLLKYAKDEQHTEETG